MNNSYEEIQSANDSPQRIHYYPKPLSDEEAYWEGPLYEDGNGNLYKIYWRSGSECQCPEGWETTMAIRKEIDGVLSNIYVEAA